MKKISLTISILALLISGIVYFKPQSPQQDYQSYISDLVDQYARQNLGASVQPYAGFSYTLYGSGLSSSATSITLTSLTIPQTSQKIVDADLSDTFYITIEPGNKTRQEIVSCTTVAQNSNGTATLSGCSRGLAPVTPYTASSTLAFAHGGNTSVIFSDPPQLFNQYPAIIDNYTISGLWTFPNGIYGVTPTSTTQLATKGYADGLSYAGSPDMTLLVKGIGEMATGFELASSTPTGNTTAPLIATSLYATSSPYTASSWIPVTDRDGKLNQTFLRLSDAFTWTNTHIFPRIITTDATSTNATTTNLYVSGAVKFDGTFSGNGVNATTTIYTANGTWTKPTGAKIVEVYVIGGGGGGGSGDVHSSDANLRDGGSGAGGGSFAYKKFLASALGTSETVVVGAGGTGGAGRGTQGGGNNGTDGGLSSFGTNLLKATGGIKGVTPGTSGNAAVGGAGGAQTNGDMSIIGGAGGNSGDSGGGAQGVDSTNVISPRGGGGAGSNGQSGAAGGGFLTYYVLAGGAANTAGATTDAGLLIGGVGGGGGNGGTAGGAGGYPGGGGGGGGGSSSASGAGGNGANGVVIVITHF